MNIILHVLVLFAFVPTWVAAGGLRVEDLNFVDEKCESVLLSGFNAWKFVEMGAKDPTKLERIIRLAKDADFEAVRFFGHGSDPDFVQHKYHHDIPLQMKKMSQVEYKQ